MKKLLRILLVILLILLAVGAGIFYFLPLNTIAEQKVIAKLAEFGLKANSIKIEKLGTSQAIITNLEFEGKQPLKIARTQAHFNAKEALKGKIQRIYISGLEANIYHQDSHWQIGGLEALMKPNNNADSKTTLNFDKLHSALPFLISITDSKINVQDNSTQITAPFDFNLYNSSQKIAGFLSSKNLSSEGLPYAIPPLDLQVNYELNAKELHTKITAHDAKNLYKADINLTAPSQDVMLGKITINNLSFPYGGGTISASAQQIPLKVDKPIKITLRLKNVEIADFMNNISNGEVSATGKVSGSLPIIYYPDGHITLQKGALNSLDNGILTVSPNLLPGESPQLTMTRETLQNFHYTTLKIAVSSKNQRQSVIILTLEGSNPDANDGRQVKLNVNLSGDIIPLIQQSLLAVDDIKQLLHIEEIYE